MATLTKEQFDKIPAGEIFAKGETVDSPKGANMTNSGKPLRFIAKKGYDNDWCIYLHWATSSWEFIESNGDKTTWKDNIQNLVPCDEEVYKAYRR